MLITSPHPKQPLKPIIINADDLGLSPAINQGIVNLAVKQRLSATSFMSHGELTREHKQQLQHCHISIGLHLDFTSELFAQHQQDFAPFTLGQLLKSTWLGQLNSQKINQQINQQLDLFEQKIGTSPSFVDGHQHIHQFPQIRHSLIQTLLNRYNSHNLPLIRHTQPSVTQLNQQTLKAWLIYYLGGQKLHQLCQKNNIKQNAQFAGVYDFNVTTDKLTHYWQHWLHTTTNHSVIMCHPALPAAEKTTVYSPWQDNIKTAREQEYHWLMSDFFTDLCQQHGVQLANWQQLNEHDNG